MSSRRRKGRNNIDYVILTRILKELDPDNGFAWMPDLERAEHAAADNAVTEAITQIGASKKMTFY
jgi:hypothetical protein